MAFELETRTVWPVELELRQAGRELVGRFPYGSMATMASRGRIRKERFTPRAFRYSVEDAQREVNLLVGHSFDHPLASKLRGSLVLEDNDDALSFRATLPPEGEQPTWMRDAVLSVKGGLMRGVSPGFTVPPASAVAKAEELIPEPGNPGVVIRQVNDAVLYELSLVTRAAYVDSEIDLRHAGGLAGRDYWELARWL